MLVNILKSTQLSVAIAATVLAGLIWPGVMVVIPVGIGIFYMILAAGACRDWMLSMWLACVMSVGVALLSTMAIGANDFAIVRIGWERGEVPPAGVSPGGEVVELESIPDDTIDDLRRIPATAVRTRNGIAALLIFVSLGSCAVLLMHVLAWRWMIFGKVNSRS